MNNLWTFFGFSIIFYSLGSINGDPLKSSVRLTETADPIDEQHTKTGSDWLTELTDPMGEQQLHILQVENENLKLRLELVELNMMKQQSHLTKLDQQLTLLIDKYERENMNAKGVNRVETYLSTLVDANKKIMSREECLPVNEETGVQSVDTNITLNILQDIQSTLTKMENKSSIELQQDLIKDDLAVIKMIGKEKPMKCIRNVDNKLVCSDFNSPTSCASSSNCFKNSCYIHNRLLGPFMVPCNDTTDGGGWTIIQRRVNDSTDFYRDWSEYKQGFGDLQGSYWIGLDKLHALTTTLAPVELRIELMDFQNVVKYAKYNSFSIGDESTKYILKNVGGYSGTAGDSFSTNKGKMFTTKDQDNDEDKSGNCAHQRHGGWWYWDCTHSNLNGKYRNQSHIPGDRTGIYWYDFRGFEHSLKFVQMMIRTNKS